MKEHIIATREALESVVEEAVTRALIEALPEAVRRANEKPFLTKREVMELTGWSSRQVEYKKANRELPFIRRGRTILFPTDAVHAYLNEGLVPARRIVR